MSSAANPSVVSRPSVFLSYASEDRTAARALRDALLAAGLDVWYDESELGGGDAWDQKIRRQIRECDYFMPVISATTERRKEGYFRREWRLAADRTYDMADDVLFLLPVVIDDTVDAGARVPERFLTVQWLRAPGGQPNTALAALTQKLLTGAHTPAPRPPLVERPLVSRHSGPALAGAAGVAGAAHSAATLPPITAAAPPPTQPHALPMPPFPTPPEGGVGHWIKFFAEVLWWGIASAWMLFNKLPRWVRVVLAIWLVITLLSTCGGEKNPTRSKAKTKEKADEAQIERAIAAVAGEVATALEKTATSGSVPEFGRKGAEIGRRMAKAMLDANAVGKRLVVLPFTGVTAEDLPPPFVTTVFTACRDRLVATLPGEMAVSTMPVQSNTEQASTELGRALGAGFILNARVTPHEGAPTLAVRLIRIQDGRVAWSENVPLHNGDAASIGHRIADAVAAQVRTASATP
jgi:hypothetical protein